MYAIVEIAGHQYKVQKDQLIFVNRLHEEEGAKVSFDRVLLIDNNGAISVGAPAVSGAQVTAKVERHLKGDKVIIFKKKRRKGYKKMNGFRASLTEIKIEGITASGAAPKAKKEEPKAEAPKAAAPSGDDLTKIEGIGPKIAELLGAAGITTFAALATADVEKMKEILAEAGSRYKMHDPTTWTKQAALAAEGNWEELQKLQDELDGGRENN